MRTDFVRKYAAFKRCQMRLAHLNGIQNVPLAHFAAKIQRSKRQNEKSFGVYYNKLLSLHEGGCIRRSVEELLHLVVNLEESYREALHIQRGHIVADQGLEDLYSLAV